MHYDRPTARPTWSRVVAARERNRIVEGFQPRTLGQILKHHRIAADLTQEELAARARLSARDISDIECGRIRTPRRRTVGRLVKALTLSPPELAALEGTVTRRRGPRTSPPT